MIKLVWKLTIDPQFDINILEMPKESKILSVSVQNSMPCLWVEFAESNKENLVNRNFLSVETGKEFSADQSHRLEYIGTIQLLSSAVYVLHIYEIKLLIAD